MRARWLVAGGLAISLVLLGTFAPWRKPVSASVLTLGGASAIPFTVATSYPTIAAAIAAVPNGGTLFVPAGTYTAPDTSGWTIDKPMTILGDGQANPNNASFDDIGTVFRPYDATNGTVFVVTGDEVIFKNFYIGNASAQSTTGAGDGIRIGSASHNPQGFRMENVTVAFMGRHGVNIMGDADWHKFAGNESSSSTYYGLDRGVFQGCQFWTNRGHGVRGNLTTTLSFSSCWFVGNRLEGLRLKNSLAATVASCGVQENGTDMSNVTWRGQASFSTVRGLNVSAFNCEEFQSTTNKNGLTVENCQGWLLTGLNFVNSTCVAATVGVTVVGASHGGLLAGWNVSNVATSVSLSAGAQNTGNLIAPPYVQDNTATCPATFSIPAASSPGDNPQSSGGNFVLWPLTVQAGGSQGLAFIGGIQPPIIGGTGAFTQTPPLGTIVFDSTSAGGASRQLRYWDGSGWKYLQGN